MKFRNFLYGLIAVLFIALGTGFVSQYTGIEPVYVAPALTVVSYFITIPEGTLAVTSFTTQLLRDVIRDHSQLDMQSGNQKFEMRTDEIAVMNAYYGMREAMLTPADVAAIENLRSSQQAIDLYLYNKRAVGVGATRKRKGTGSAVTATVTPTFFAVIEEGLDMSYVNHAIRQYGSEGADKKQIVARAYTDHMQKNLPQVFRNIYTRANAQFIAHLEANRWALTGTADAGTIYTTVTGDAKNIPVATPLTEIIQNMQIEAQQNNFLQLGTPLFLTSPTAAIILNEYLARGAANETNVIQFLAWFNHMQDNGIIDAGTDDATIYEIAAGSLAGYSRAFSWESHPDNVGGVVRKGEDEWSNLVIGGADTGIFTNLPEVKLEVKAFSGFADNSATLDGNPDEGKIDIDQNFSFVAQFGGLQAYEADANISPILKYILKNI